jgi:gamma-glutamyltranspeptidase/glutathione hydrolase
VKQWPYWKADVKDVSNDRAATDVSPVDRTASLGLDSAGVSKNTTHMTVIDKDGNIFDATPSGGWVPGAVILGDTGIGMSVRGEQFWLDLTPAAQIRPRSRPRYTLTPSIVFKGDVPMMGIGTPGGDNQDQTILQGFLSVVAFCEMALMSRLPRVCSPNRKVASSRASAAIVGVHSNRPV